MSDEDLPDDDLPESPNPNAATGKGVRRQKEKLKNQDQLVREFWKAVLADPIGRSEVWRILKTGGAFTAPFACGPTGFPQSEATFFKAGQQALVLGEYHRLLRLDFDGIKLMLDENDPEFKKMAAL